MAGTVNASHSDIAPDINTTPLIDVMLVLLTLLIMTLPLQTHAIKIDTGHGTPPLNPPPTVHLSVEWDGSASWNGIPVDRATLHARLVEAARENPQPDIVLHADKLARYDAVARVLADAAQAGDTRIGFAPDQ